MKSGRKNITRLDTEAGFISDFPLMTFVPPKGARGAFHFAKVQTTPLKPEWMVLQHDCTPAQLNTRERFM